MTATRKTEPIVIPASGDRLNFLVLSRSRHPYRWLVDMEANDYFGDCGCEDHEFSVQPALNRKEEDVEACYHVKKVREYLLAMMLPKLAKHFEAPKLARHLETHA